MRVVCTPQEQGSTLPNSPSCGCGQGQQNDKFIHPVLSWESFPDLEDRNLFGCNLCLNMGLHMLVVMLSFFSPWAKQRWNDGKLWVHAL